LFEAMNNEKRIMNNNKQKTNNEHGNMKDFSFFIFHLSLISRKSNVC